MISLPGGEFEEREVKGWIIFTAMLSNEVSDSGLRVIQITNSQYHFRISGLKMQISFYDFHFIISFGLGGFTSMNRRQNNDELHPPTCKN